MKNIGFVILFFSSLTVSMWGVESVDPLIKDRKLFDPKRPLERELEMSVPDGFTLSGVGDCIIARPLSQYAERDEAFASVLKILRESDATVGNLETTFVDMKNFKGYPYSWEGDWTLSTDPLVAKDLLNMGFDLFSRANNHVMDWGLEGLRETTRWLDEAGLIHAGTGENESLARSARYFESTKGRIAIVSMVSTFRPTTNALPAHGTAPGRPGVNGLALKKITIVTPKMMESLKELKAAIRSQEKTPSATKKGDAQTALSLFGNEFEVGKAYGYRYEMDKFDLQGILKSIRSGKQNSDFLIATIHAHESANNIFPELPAEFLHDLARACIDAGADTFMTTGIHHLGPIEVYKNKPIFYGLGNFFWSDIQEPLPSDLHSGNRELVGKAFQHPEMVTDPDLTNVLNARSFANDATFQTVVAVSRFEKGGLSEVRLYPVDLGYGRKLTESGTPRLADPANAATILQRVQKISIPYGTNLVIENNIGLIRPQSSNR